MAEAEELHLIGDDEVAFRLELTPPELKVTFTALHTLLDGLGHDERDVQEFVRRVIDKLPEEHSIKSIELPGKRR
jgi:hypothetical protein